MALVSTVTLLTEPPEPFVAVTVINTLWLRNAGLGIATPPAVGAVAGV
jgi:hypothetical protein